MEFDEGKLYTMANADKVKIGSRGYFADTIKGLRCVMEQGNGCPQYGKVYRIDGENEMCRFILESNCSTGYRYSLFYLVEEPKVEVKPLSLNEIAKLSYENAKKRENNGGHISTETRAMLKHCATEVVEAVEAYTNWSWDLTHQAECKDSFASELADIICCCTIIAESELIDLDKAVADCLEKNRKRAEGTGDKL